MIDKKDYLLRAEQILLTSFAYKVHRDNLSEKRVNFAGIYYDDSAPRFGKHGWYGIVGYLDGTEISQRVNGKKSFFPENLDVLEIANQWTQKLRRIAVGDFNDLPDFVDQLEFEKEFVDI
jgi:hypothetical protein